MKKNTVTIEEDGRELIVIVNGCIVYNTTSTRSANEEASEWRDAPYMADPRGESTDKRMDAGYMYDITH